MPKMIVYPVGGLCEGSIDGVVWYAGVLPVKGHRRAPKDVVGMVKQAAAENSDHGVMLGCGKNCLLLENGDFLGFPKHNQGQIFGTKNIRSKTVWTLWETLKRGWLVTSDKRHEQGFEPCLWKARDDKRAPWSRRRLANIWELQYLHHHLKMVKDILNQINFSLQSSTSSPPK